MESLTYKSYDLISLSILEEVTDILEDYVYEDNLDIAKEVICAICQNIVNLPTSCSTCQNLFCKKCIDQWKRSSNKCPMRCNQPYLKLQDTPKNTMNLINKIKLKCLKFADGCTEAISYENFFKHIRNCKYIRFQCEYCQLEGNYENSINHSKNCIYSYKECKSCKLRCKKKEYDAKHNNNTCIRDTGKFYIIIY